MKKIIIIILISTLLTGCGSTLATVAAISAGVVVAAIITAPKGYKFIDSSRGTEAPYVPSAVQSMNKFNQIDKEVARDVASRTGGYSAERAATTGHGYEPTSPPTHNRLEISSADTSTSSYSESSSVSTHEDASSGPSPTYKPQVVNIPKADLVCPTGYTWHNPAGTGAPGGTCYKDSNGQAELSSNNADLNNNKLDGMFKKVQADTSTDTSTPTSTEKKTTSEKQPAKTKWGSIQYEALAICRQSEKSGKWWCDGPGQELLLVDSPSVEDALNGVGCSSGTSAAGGTTKGGKSADVYRCGYGLNSWDRDIKKIHGLTTAQRSYMCPELNGGNCTTIYDGQDKS
ncbi:MAG: hypothetical protein Q8L15_14175 [Methylobacter sp.]|nr:hypothetical protein [Methylobacter sp.]